jgi:hypothetical protein
MTKPVLLTVDDDPEVQVARFLVDERMPQARGLPITPARWHA